MIKNALELRREKLSLIINKIYTKIYNNNYYIEDENKEIRGIIGKNNSKMHSYFQKEMAKIYDIVADKVCEEYERKNGDFNIVDYCYITDIDPICLLNIFPTTNPKLAILDNPPPIVSK